MKKFIFSIFFLCFVTGSYAQSQNIKSLFSKIDSTGRCSSWSDSADFYLSKKDSLEALQYYKRIMLRQDTLNKELYSSEAKLLKSENQIDKLYLEKKQLSNKVLKRYSTALSIILILGIIGATYLTRKVKILNSKKNKLYFSREEAEKTVKENTILLNRISKEIETPLKDISKETDHKNISKKIFNIHKTIKDIIGISLFFIISIQCWSMNDKVLKERDSLLNVFNKEENIEARFKLYNSLKTKLRSKEYSNDINKYILDLAIENKNEDAELSAIAGYYNTAFYNSLSSKDLEKMELIKFYANKHKELSLKYGKTLSPYFGMSKSYISLLSSNGYMEKGIIEAKSLIKEAEKHENKKAYVSASLALANAYFFTRNNTKALEISSALLEIKDLNPLTILDIRFQIFNCMYNLSDYAEANKFNLETIEIINKEIKRDAKLFKRFQGKLLELESRSADCYYYVNNFKKMKQHLDKAAIYYTEDCFPSYYVLYHTTLAQYYSGINDFNSCMKELSLVESRAKETGILHINSINRSKIKFMERAAKYTQGINICFDIIKYVDSTDTGFRAKQETIIKANYKWEQGLLKKAKLEYWLQISYIVIISILLLFVISFIIVNYYLSKAIKSTNDELEQNLEKASKNIALKASIIKNIESGLALPINDLINLAESGKLLEAKGSSSKIVSTLQKTIEFSFLENRQMNFDIQEYDILEVCFECVDAINNLHQENLNFSFVDNTGSQMVKIDKNAFIKCLFTIFNISQSNKLETIEVTLSYTETGSDIEIIIVGSPLAQNVKNNINNILQNNINRLTIETFKGTYNYTDSKLRSLIKIRLPFNTSIYE